MYLQKDGFLRNDKIVLLMHNKRIKTQTQNIYPKLILDWNPNEAALQPLKHEFIKNLSANERKHNVKYFNGWTSEKRFQKS